jgi:hypothetical protein
VATPDGAQRQLSVAEFEDKWRAGVLGDRAVFWRAGMADWRPVTEYVPTAPIPEPVFQEPVPGGSGLRLAPATRAEAPVEKIASLEPVLKRPVIPMTYTKDPMRLTYVVMALMWFGLVIDIFLTGGIAGMLFGGEEESPAVLASSLVMVLSGLAWILVHPVTAILFLMWVYRMKSNCVGFGTMGLKYSPGWSVGWFFVPIACWFMPYKSMAETWRASASPHNWSGVQTGSIVGIWWALWIGVNILMNVASSFDMESKDPQHRQALLVTMGVLLVVDLLLVYVTTSMMKRMYLMQKALVDNQVPMKLDVPLGAGGMAASTYR